MQLYAIRKSGETVELTFVETKDVFKLCQNVDGYFWMNIKTNYEHQIKYKTLTDAIFDLYSIKEYIEFEFFIDDESALNYIKSSSS